MPTISPHFTKGYQLKQIQEMAKIPITWSVTNTNYDNINIMYFQGLTATSIAGGTVGTTQTTNQPLVVRKVFSHRTTSYNGYVLNSSLDFPRFSTTTAGDGIEFTLPQNIAIRTDEFIRLLLRVSSNTATATIILRAVNGTDTVTWTTQSLTHIANNEWGALILDLNTGTKTGGVNNSTVYSKISVIMSASNTVDVYEFEKANNQLEFIGCVTKIPFSCLTEFSPELDQSIEDIKCFNMTEDTAVSERGLTLNFTTAKFNLLHFSALFGSNIEKRSDVLNTVVLNGTGGTTNALISANQLNLNQTVDPKNIMVFVGEEELVLQRVENTANLSVGTFHITTAGLITFATGAYNGQSCRVLEVKPQTGHLVEVSGLSDSFEGPLIVVRTLQDGTRIVDEFPRAKMINHTFSQDDGSASFEVELRILPVNENGKYRFWNKGML